MKNLLCKAATTYLSSYLAASSDDSKTRAIDSQVSGLQAFGGMDSGLSVQAVLFRTL